MSFLPREDGGVGIATATGGRRRQSFLVNVGRGGEGWRGHGTELRIIASRRKNERKESGGPGGRGECAGTGWTISDLGTLVKAAGHSVN